MNRCSSAEMNLVSLGSYVILSEAGDGIGFNEEPHIWSRPTSAAPAYLIETPSHSAV